MIREQVKKIYIISEILSFVNSSLAVDLSDIDQKIEELSNVDNRKLCDICKPGIRERISDIENYDPVVIAFNIPPDMQCILADLKR